MSYVRKEEKSFGDLFSDLSYEMQSLIRAEFQLAKNEMTGKVARGVKDSRSVAIGGAVLYAGLLAIVAAGIFLLGIVIPLWLSALIIGVVVSGIGYFMVRSGVTDMKRLDLTPNETISSLKEDKKWLKEKM